MEFKIKLRRFLALVLMLSMVSPLIPSMSEAAAPKPRLNVKKLEITVGDSFLLRVYNLNKKQKAVFSSSNEDVVSFDDSKKSTKRTMIVAKSIGSATVKVTVKKGKRVVKQMKCRVKVSPNAVSIKFTKKLVELHPQEQARLETLIKPVTSTEQPVFESDDPEVVTVSSLGVVTAVSPGIVTITATLLSTNQTATCKVVVIEEEETPEYPDYLQKSVKHLVAGCGV